VNEPAAERELRVSVATLDRVLLPDPEDGRPLLALERKATLLPDGRVFFTAQPFGGAVRIRDPVALRERVGAFRFDSPRSEEDEDLRIFISPGQWPVLRRLCLEDLAAAVDLAAKELPAAEELPAADADEEPIEPTGEAEGPQEAPLPGGAGTPAAGVRPPEADREAGRILDGDPIRELVEEFQDALHIILQPEQYTCRPARFVVVDRPVPTTSRRSPGALTARIYRIFEVQILDPALRQALLNSSRLQTDADLQALARADARRGGQGYASAALVLPLETVTRHYLSLPPPARAGQTTIAGYTLDPSVAAILEGVEIGPDITIPHPGDMQRRRRL
jgi:hypothetical protein